MSLHRGSWLDYIMGNVFHGNGLLFLITLKSTQNTVHPSRGVARIFQRGGYSRDTIFNNGFYSQDIVMAFSPPEKAYQGEVTGTPGTPLATPLHPLHLLSTLSTYAAVSSS